MKAGVRSDTWKKLDDLFLPKTNIGRCIGFLNYKYFKLINLGWIRRVVLVIAIRELKSINVKSFQLTLTQILHWKTLKKCEIKIYFSWNECFRGFLLVINSRWHSVKFEWTELEWATAKTEMKIGGGRWKKTTRRSAILCPRRLRYKSLRNNFISEPTYRKRSN